VPAPHNEMQRATIAIFVIEFTDYDSKVIARRSAGILRQTPQVSKAINARAVSIRPTWLQRISAYKIEAGKLKTLVCVSHMRAQHIAQRVRLATTRCARTRAPEHLEFQIRFLSIVPANRQFVSDLLNVCWLQTHLSNRQFVYQGFTRMKHGSEEGTLIPDFRNP